jgi:hypothetical protein
MANDYVFPGHGPALAASLEAHGQPLAVASVVSGLKPFRDLTSLVSQAFHGLAEHAPAILDEAEKHLAALRVAVETAERVIAEARAALVADVTPVPQAAPAAKGKRA